MKRAKNVYGQHPLGTFESNNILVVSILITDCILEKLPYASDELNHANSTTELMMNK